jgi:hypothetical protein
VVDIVHHAVTIRVDSWSDADFTQDVVVCIVMYDVGGLVDDRSIWHKGVVELKHAGLFGEEVV